MSHNRYKEKITNDHFGSRVLGELPVELPSCLVEGAASGETQPDLGAGS